jgi:hypothetical protein
VVDGDVVNLGQFVAALDALTIDDIRALALDLDGMIASPGEEIEVTRAYLAIEATLRKAHRLRDAAHAGHRASTAVTGAAARAGAPLPDPAVTRVARAAATIARGLVAETNVAAELAFLLQGFRHARPVALLV